jgi:hypothetical protein
MESFATVSPSQLSDSELLHGRDQVLHQMAWARQYSLQLIDSVPHALWYVQPAQAQTHVAWQVGHLAVSQYGLMLFRQRGRLPGDLELMPGWLRKQFGRGTQPAASADGMPTPTELLERLGAIHKQALQEVQALSAETLRETTEMPYAAYPIKLGALLFCPLHESLHAGQIGLLRRLHGLDPIR